MLAFITSSQPSLATEKPDESVSITLAGQLEAPVQRFGQAKQRILWLSDQATQEADSTLAKALANAGLEVWLTPLQATAKQEKTSKPLNSAAIAELIEESIPSKPEDKLYVFSTGNSAKATVDALKIWQDARGSSAQLGGLILAYPHLQTEKSTSKHPEFIEASTQLKLPIYIFQPANKLKVAVAENLVATLEQGSSVVYSELVEDAGDGYLQNQSHSEEETLQLSLFPAKLAQALEKLTEATTKPQ
ncbi:MAG TPA: hypothetical protein PLM98_14625, partial [Thiolinea sp.]|nr:hypothetical protein [Thiolinea sp.]